MEGALRMCVCQRTCVCLCREITSQRTWKCVFFCLPARDSEEISRQPNIPPVFSQQKQEVEYQPLRLMPQGQAWNEPRLHTPTHTHTLLKQTRSVHTAGATNIAAVFLQCVESNR